MGIMQPKIEGNEAEKKIATALLKPWYCKVESWLVVINILALAINIFLILSREKTRVIGEAKTAVFNCDNSKTITATFYLGDDRYVDLVLSDGRKMSVPRAISASGARYANADESFVFWNKGDTAFITEGNSTTFSGCITNTQ